MFKVGKMKRLVFYFMAVWGEYSKYVYIYAFLYIDIFVALIMPDI